MRDRLLWLSRTSAGTERGKSVLFSKENDRKTNVVPQKDYQEENDSIKLLLLWLLPGHKKGMVNGND